MNRREEAARRRRRRRSPPLLPPLLLLLLLLPIRCSHSTVPPSLSPSPSLLSTLPQGGREKSVQLAAVVLSERSIPYRV
jgi:hypothetical protein